MHNQSLSYNMSCGYDMGGGIMNVNANTTAAVKTKQGLWLEENKPHPDRMKTGSFYCPKKNLHTAPV